jgi:hypothetical protein
MKSHYGNDSVSLRVSFRHCVLRAYRARIERYLREQQPRGDMRAVFCLGHKV